MKGFAEGKNATAVRADIKNEPRSIAAAGSGRTGKDLCSRAIQPKDRKTRV